MNAHASAGTLLARSLDGLEVRTPARAAAVLLAAALTAAAAQFTLVLPGTAVPFTLTPLVVMLTGAALGSRLGFAAQALYLAAGAAGAPVFAPSPLLPPGALRLIGPTGGYLMAYPVAAFATGWLAERGWDRRYVTSLVGMLAGLAIIFSGGVSWMVIGLQVAPSVAFVDGFARFILPDLIKAALAAMILPQAWNVLGRSYRT
jgi:biotin transport system substrate-specific component